MARKHHAPQSPDDVLGILIAALETDDDGLVKDERTRDELLTTYRDALLGLLANGPLLCDRVVMQEAGDDAKFSHGHALNLRAEILQLLRSAVRRSAFDQTSTPIELRSSLTLNVRLDANKQAHVA